MKAAASSLAGKYQKALRAYLAHGTEEMLQQAYELGRQALSRGKGILDVVRIHQEAAAKSAGPERSSGETAKRVRTLATFLMEALSPFEVAHRGFRDTCDRLKGLNKTLEQRNGQLAATNRKLQQEIVRRQSAQLALLESEEKFRSVVESAQDGILTIDSRGRLVSINYGAELLLGYEREELLGKSVMRLIPRAQRTRARERLQKLVEGGEQQLLKRPVESSALHRTGREVSIELSLALWRTSGGWFLTGIVRDITERKRAEQALRESREHYMRLFQQAREMEESLRRLSNKVLTAQEEERRHISRELHEEIGQALTAVNVSIALLRKHAAEDALFRQKVDSAQRLIEQSMDIVHRFARELRPSMLDHLGPYAALQNYIKSFTERTGIRIDLESADRLEQLDVQRSTVLYRVAQESLTNVFKHANATRVRIRLKRSADAICMEIRDNGRPSLAPVEGNGAEAGRPPIGLLGMQERVRLVNGEVAIESTPQRGTTVRVQIPLSSPPTLREPGGTLLSALN